MYSYEWDGTTGGYILTSTASTFSKEPRPVYYRELDILGFDKYWKYEKNDTAPYMWAESSQYIYRGRVVANTEGGSLYTAPKLQIHEENLVLEQVDIEKMVIKNKVIMDALTNTTIKNIYSKYIEYINKVDVFYVAFSGGKDSVAVLDLVQRALPHNSFKVVFGDTGMELPDTHLVRSKIEDQYPDIEVYTARSDVDALVHWEQFGPPAHTMRWCCNVHKTSPQMILLRKILENPQFKGFAFTGVRKDESVARSEYDDIGEGKKHNGQVSYHPIIEWGAAELFLYIYRENLLINDAYKKGNSRVGCIVCPMSSGKHEYMKSVCYPNDVEKYIDVIKKTSNKKFETEAQMNQFLEYGGWKMRRSGRELCNTNEQIVEEIRDMAYIFRLKKYPHDWITWTKTIGTVILETDSKYFIKFRQRNYTVIIKKEGKDSIFEIPLITRTKEDIKFISLFKSVLTKSVYCIRCGECVAECKNGYIHMDDSTLSIDEECIKCTKCHDMDYGCLVYNSIRNPKGAGKNMGNGSIERYLTFGFDHKWLEAYLPLQEKFWESQSNTLGSKMIPVCKKFLLDSGVIEDVFDAKSKKRIVTRAGEVVTRLGSNNDIAWAIMLVNLSYTPQFNWYIKNTKVETTYLPEEIKLRLGELLSDVQKRNFVDAFKNIFVKTPIGSTLGLGDCDVEIKNGKIFLNSMRRTTWEEPDLKVVLYSLYKFAETCHEYYQFTVSRLMEYSIESDGISPSEIFGLNKNTMVRLLNGLSINYPDYVSVSFTHDLENISLNPEKNSLNVLELF